MRNNSLIDHLLSIAVLPGTVTLLIPYFLYQYLSEPTIYDDHIVLKIIGYCFMLIGLILFLSSIFMFRIKGKGTLAPWSPTSKLVIDGPYKYVRNPMIIGVISILTGEAFLLNTISILIWAMLFFIINTVYFEFMEEPRLERKFGDDYVSYKNNVNRWIPKMKPYNPE